MKQQVIAFAPYFDARNSVDVVADGRWTYLEHEGKRHALGPRQVLSVLDALYDLRRRGYRYDTAVGGLKIDGGFPTVRLSCGHWSVGLSRRQFATLLSQVDRRSKSLEGRKVAGAR